MHLAAAVEQHFQQPHGIDRPAGAGDGEDEGQIIEVGVATDAGIRINSAYRPGLVPRYFLPTYNVAIPNVSGQYFTFFRPTPRIRSASASPSGNWATVAGRYS